MVDDKQGDLTKINEGMEKIQAQIEDQFLSTHIAFGSNVEHFKKIFKPLNEFHNTLMNSFRKYDSFRNPFGIDVDKLSKIAQMLQDKIAKLPESYLLIAHHGWFIDLDSEVFFSSKVAELFRNEKIEEANNLLIEYYKPKVEEIIRSLTARHPSRKEILENILFAFNNKQHFLLVPVALTQVDGICNDFNKKKFFINSKEKEYRKKYLPEIIVELEKSVGEFLSLFLSPLQNQIPIKVSENYVNDYPCHLNRHEIIHGIATDYGTEINSLKVISLLKYISDLLSFLGSEEQSG